MILWYTTNPVWILYVLMLFSINIWISSSIKGKNHCLTVMTEKLVEGRLKSMILQQKSVYLHVIDKINLLERMCAQSYIQSQQLAPLLKQKRVCVAVSTRIVPVPCLWSVWNQQLGFGGVIFLPCLQHCWGAWPSLGTGGFDQSEASLRCPVLCHLRVSKFVSGLKVIFILKKKFS